MAKGTDVKAISMTAVSKDLHRLIRRAGKVTNDQASVWEPDWDNPIYSFKVNITPNSGYYEGNTYTFEIRIPKDYEYDEPPDVVCETNIYHPNINTSTTFPRPGRVCLNILDEGTWQRRYGLETIVKGLVYLLKNPNFEDPLTAGFAHLDLEDFEASLKNF